MVRFMMKPLDEMNKKHIRTIQILIKVVKKNSTPSNEEVEFTLKLKLKISFFSHRFLIHPFF